MSKWISVMVTVLETCPQHNRCRFFYDDEQAGIHIEHTLSYEEGMKALQDAEKLLKKPAERRTNQYSSDIYYMEIFGYIDQE